jgi:2-phosphosulfolactate phosphatase
MFYDQSVYDVRFEWGPEGVRRLAQDATAVVIVDALTFSTAVDVAVGRGAAVIPFRVGGEMAEAAARDLGALLAVPREHVSPARPYSLSPGTLAVLAPGDRLLLPSPNGATLTLLAVASGAIVGDDGAMIRRNSSAKHRSVASHLARRNRRGGRCLSGRIRRRRGHDGEVIDILCLQWIR